jgi:hypothetical protein
VIWDFWAKQIPQIRGISEGSLLCGIAHLGRVIEFNDGLKLNPAAPEQASGEGCKKQGELGEKFSPNYFTISCAF